MITSAQMMTVMTERGECEFETLSRPDVGRDMVMFDCYAKLVLPSLPPEEGLGISHKETRRR
jgi:hypothetical protein